MKLAKFAIATIFLVTFGLSNCCEGRSTSSSGSQGRPSIDCGNYQDLNRSTSFFQRPWKKMSLVSSMIRGNFASSFKRTYTCWRASNLTEIKMTSENTSALESILEFSLDKSSLENITSAILTLSFAYPANLSVENDQSQLIVLEVKGTASANGIQLMSPRLMDENAVMTADHHLVVKFDVLDFLQASHDEDSAEDSSSADEVTQKKKLVVKFYVIRQCDIPHTDICSKMFDKAVHTPSLRVFYV